MNPELSRFIDRATERRQHSEEIFNWHVKAAHAGLPIPYDHTDTYVSANVYDTIDDKYDVDVEATLDKLALIVQYATDQGLVVVKSYDYNFEVAIEVSETLTIYYHAKRDSVCVKKVVGTKIVPAKITEEKVEEVIEWECEKIAFLAREV